MWLRLQFPRRRELGDVVEEMEVRSQKDLDPVVSPGWLEVNALQGSKVVTEHHVVFGLCVGQSPSWSMI